MKRKMRFLFLLVVLLPIVSVGCPSVTPISTTTSKPYTTAPTPPPTTKLTTTPIQTTTSSPLVDKPKPFTMTEPVLGTVSPSSVPEFDWVAASGATSYTLEVATSTSFGSTNIINQTGITTNSFTPATPLPAGVVYYWRVTAINSAGSTVATNAPFWCSKRFSIGSNSAEGLAVTPDGSRAVISGDGDTTGMVAVVSLSNPPKIVATIPVGKFLGQVAITPDGSRALVRHDFSKISVINLVNNTVIKTIQASVGTTLYGIAITPDGTKAIVPNLYLGYNLGIIDLSTYGTAWVDLLGPSGAVQKLASADVCTGVAVSPDGQKALVTTNAGGKLLIIDINSHSLVATVTNLGVSNSVAVTPDGRTALVDGANGLRRIDLTSNTVTATIDFKTGGNGWHNIAITPDGSRAVVAGGAKGVGIISLTDNTVLVEYAVGGVPQTVAITPDGTRAVIASVYDGTISIIPLISK